MRKYFVLLVCSILSLGLFAQEKFKTVTVQPKQTFYGIAREHNVPPADLKKANEQYAPDYKLKTGDKLRVPASGGMSTVPIKAVENTTTEKPKAAPKKDEKATAGKPTSTVQIHVVKKGETLVGIAKNMGMTTKELRTLNGFSENINVKIGQKIKVKGLAAKTTEAKAKTEPGQILYKPMPEKPVAPAKESTPTDNPPAKEEPKTNAQVIKRNDKIQILEYIPTTTTQTTTPPPPVKKETSELETTYASSINNDTKKTIRGIGVVSNDSELTSSAFALYNNAEQGDIIKVVNMMSKKVAYLKVIGKIAKTDSNDEVILKVSPETAKLLNANEDKFLVEVTGY